MNPFTDDVIEAVRRHMNGAHAEDCLVITRALGGQPAATGATMTGMDGAGIDFEAIVDDEPIPVRVPWPRPISERAQVRAEVVRLYDRSLELLGLPPRADQH